MMVISFDSSSPIHSTINKRKQISLPETLVSFFQLQIYTAFSCLYHQSNLKCMMSTASTAGSRISGDEIDMVSPVFDGNKVKIVVPFQRTAGGSGFHEKKVRVEVPIPRNLLIPSTRWNDHARLLVQNHRNFKESGMPVRFMIYKDGSWRDLEKNAMDVLVSAFVCGKGMVEVETEGRKLIFYFYRMLGIELDSGNEQFISWIDISGKCFYPKIFIEGSENLDKNEENFDENFVDPKIELEIRIIEKKELGKRKRDSEEDDVEMEVGSSSRPTELVPPKWLRTRPMMDEESLYKKVKSVLCAVMLGGVTVTAVHKCTRTSPMEQARFVIFQRTVEMVGRARGDPRLEYAWYGTSSKNVASIMDRGFEMPVILPGSHTHGIGIYLSSLCSPQKSDIMSELDENGEKHIILCKVIVGKVEKVELGSQQLFPSSADFDTGVDDLINPKLHVVWCGNMNTHILPLYIVSYKYVRPMSVQLNGGAHAYTTLILLKIQRSLPPPKKLEFQSLYRCYQEGKVGHAIFMRQLHSIVGEELLHSIILETRGLR